MIEELQLTFLDSQKLLNAVLSFQSVTVPKKRRGKGLESLFEEASAATPR
jgi:hypothetical protein